MQQWEVILQSIIRLVAVQCWLEFADRRKHVQECLTAGIWSEKFSIVLYDLQF